METGKSLCKVGIYQSWLTPDTLTKSLDEIEDPNKRAAPWNKLCNNESAMILS